MDRGDQRAAFQRMVPKRNINIGKLLSLLNAVREYGFSAVAMGLSPAMKALLLKACKKCGISLKKQAKNVSYSIAESKIPERSVEKPSQPFFFFQKKDDLLSTTSPFFLEMAIRHQKEQNNRYLQLVLKRAEDRAKEKYFNRIRLALIIIAQQQGNGIPLTKDQIKIKELAERFGLQSDKNKEKLTREQQKQRQLLSLQELPKDVQEQLNIDKKRYRAIHASKNKAADLVYMIHKKEMLNGKKVDLTALNLAREAVSFLPPPEKRSVENLALSMQKIKNFSLKQKEEITQIRNKKQQNASTLIRDSMSSSSKSRPKPLHQQIKNIKTENLNTSVQRKSFLSNTVIQELLSQQQKNR